MGYHAMFGAPGVEDRRRQLDDGSYTLKRDIISELTAKACTVLKENERTGNRVITLFDSDGRSTTSDLFTAIRRSVPKFVAGQASGLPLRGISAPANPNEWDFEFNTCCVYAREFDPPPPSVDASGQKRLLILLDGGSNVSFETDGHAVTSRCPIFVSSNSSSIKT